MAHINNKLAAYLDEELDARIRAQVEEHLNVCQRCRQELEEIRLGAIYAQKRPMFTPSEKVWENLEKEIIANRNTKSSHFIKIRKQSRKRFLYLSSVLATVFLLVTGWWWWASNQPVQIDFDQYLATIEAQPEDGFPRAFAVLPPGFERVNTPVAVKAAGIEQVGFQIPIPDFELVSSRMKQVSGHDVIQFLYGKSGQAFVVFVANKAVKFRFADREIASATVKEITGGTIGSEKLSTFWTGSGDFQTLLVSRFNDTELTAAIVRHFVTAHSEEKE